MNKTRKKPALLDEPGYHGECWVCGGLGNKRQMHAYQLPSPIPAITVHHGACRERLVLALTGGLYAVAGCYQRDGKPAAWLAGTWTEEDAGED